MGKVLTASDTALNFAERIARVIVWGIGTGVGSTILGTFIGFVSGNPLSGLVIGVVLGMVLLVIFAFKAVSIASENGSKSTEDFKGADPTAQVEEKLSVQPKPIGRIWIKDTSADHQENQILKLRVGSLKKELQKMNVYKERVELGLALRNAHGEGNKLYSNDPDEQNIANWVSKTHKLIQDGLGEKEASLFLSNEGLSEHPVGTLGQKKIAPRLTRLQHILNRQAYLKAKGK